MIKLQTRDHKTKDQFIECEEDVLMMSNLLKTMIETSGPGDEDDAGSNSSDEERNDEESMFPVPNVGTEVMEKVILFMKKHKDEKMKPIEKPLRSEKMEEVVDEWDAKYIDVKQDLLFEIILAANYLDIKDLLDLSCAKVASLIKGKTPAEIRKTFNITEDFTPEEEAKVRKDNPWLETV